MAITTALCNSWKNELPQGLHQHQVTAGNTFKAALYTNAATLGASTTAYTPTGEVAAGGGYTTGGENCTNIDPQLTGSVSHFQFQNVTWAASTITSRGCLFYNSTNGDRSVSVHDFGSDQSSSNGDFTLVMPSNTSTTALYRIA